VVRSFYQQHRELTADEVRGLAVTLWDAPIFERRTAAVMLLIADAARSRPQDIELVERLLGEREFCIRKALGWVRRETGKKIALSWSRSGCGRRPPG
jgi:3-methyladenine DNA glycosylase AlkD